MAIDFDAMVNFFFFKHFEISILNNKISFKTLYLQLHQIYFRISYLQLNYNRVNSGLLDITLDPDTQI